LTAEQKLALLNQAVD